MNAIKHDSPWVQRGNRVGSFKVFVGVLTWFQGLTVGTYKLDLDGHCESATAKTKILF